MDYKVTLTGIVWATDGASVDLPRSLTYHVTANDSDDAVAVAIDRASDDTGWLIYDTGAIVERG